MATISFRIKGKGVKRATIYCRFSNGRLFRQESKTKLCIEPNYWNHKKGLPKMKPLGCEEIVIKLKQLENFIFNQYFNTNNIELLNNNKWLQNKISVFENNFGVEKPIRVLIHVDFIIANAHSRANQKGGIGLSNSRIKSYHSFKIMILDYETEIKKEIYFSDINLNFFEEFTKWLFKKNFSVNYIGKNINLLKTICLDARKNGILIFQEINDVKILKEKKKPEEILYLSFDEIKIISQLKLQNKSLINARKWLLLGCYTGQRGGDLMSFHNQKIVCINALSIIEWKQQKTGKMVAIPVLPTIEKIVNDSELKSISLQKFGIYCKEIGKLSGFNSLVPGRKTNPLTKLREKGMYPKHELMSSHICRRSFATNFYGIIPTPTLIQITAHSSEQMFLKYIGKTSYDHAQKMADGYKELLKSLNKK